MSGKDFEICLCGPSAEAQNRTTVELKTIRLSGGLLVRWALITLPHPLDVKCPAQDLQIANFVRLAGPAIQSTPAEAARGFSIYRHVLPMPGRRTATDVIRSRHRQALRLYPNAGADVCD